MTTWPTLNSVASWISCWRDLGQAGGHPELARQLSSSTYRPNLMSDEQGAAQPEQTFNIRKIYLKDLSFESPQAPGVFQQTTTPQIDINLATDSQQVEEGSYEVSIKITISAKGDDKPLFIVELDQAGIFQIEGVVDEQLKFALGVTCPNILFPYARQVISDMTVSGGFPPLVMSPVNFELLYRQKLQSAGETSKTTH
jgi:preprotein translocase subunit SecB